MTESVVLGKEVGTFSAIVYWPLSTQERHALRWVWADFQVENGKSRKFRDQGPSIVEMGRTLGP